MKRCYSLKRNKEFRRVYRVGKSVRCHSMVLVYNKARHNTVKIGFSVSKKLGNSVTRNRIRRRMTEAVRLQLDSIAAGHNLIFIAREPIKTEEFTHMMNSVGYLVRKASLLNTGDAQ